MRCIVVLYQSVKKELKTIMINIKVKIESRNGWMRRGTDMEYKMIVVNQSEVRRLCRFYVCRVQVLDMFCRSFAIMKTNRMVKMDFIWNI